MYFKSNGKLLLTGEYVVLDGAKALAIPTQFNQDLKVSFIDDSFILWKSLNEKNQVWFDCTLALPDFQLINASYYSQDENPKENIAEALQSILKEVRRLNPDFLKDVNGIAVETRLSFLQNWGLGSSSTLINNIAKWAQVDAYELLKNTFGGSGYDIACAQHNSPIIYQLIDNKPIITEVDFNPLFKEQLYFVHLNKKQNSREGIARYKKFNNDKSTIIDEISFITNECLKAKSLSDYEKLMQAHEEIISEMIRLKPIQQSYFSDYFGQIKSLGAWGGDFVLATGNEKTPSYFINKGFKTIIPFQQMIK